MPNLGPDRTAEVCARCKAWLAELVPHRVSIAALGAKLYGRDLDGKANGRSRVRRIVGGLSAPMPDMTFRLGEALRDLGVEWCSGPIALFGAGYHADAIAIVASRGGWPLVNEVFRAFDDFSLNVDAPYPPLPDGSQIAPELRSTHFDRIRREMVERARQTLVQINAREVGFNEASALWFPRGEDGPAKALRRLAVVNRLDPLSRQAYSIASDRAFSPDGRERFIRLLILHSAELMEV